MGGKHVYKSAIKAYPALKLKLPLFLVLTLFFLPISLVLADYLAYYQKIHRGVYVLNYHLGGLTIPQAERKLRVSIFKALENPVYLIHKDRYWKLKPEEIVTSIKIQDSVKEAFKVGREGNLLRQIRTRYSLWKAHKNIPLKHTLNNYKLSTFFKKIKSQVETPARSAYIEISKGKAHLIPSRMGVEIQEKRLLQQIDQNLFQPEKPEIRIPAIQLSPHLTTEEVKTAFTEARTMLSAPAILGFKNYSWTIKPEEIERLIAFKEVREKGQGSRMIHKVQAYLNSKETEALLKSLTKDISSAPKDATFEVSGDKVNIVPSKDGFQVDTTTSLPELEEALRSKYYRQAKIVMTTVRPRLTTEMAASMGIRELISTFTTYFDSRATSRVHNIRLLARTLDGKIVAPGEVFSFNKAIGPRTAAKGYKEAPTIINGELVPTFGGGVCQVGTTFFNTIFFGGYEIVERHNHSFYISKYPVGRDATVSYGGYDLKFRNDTPYHLLIKTASSQGSLTVSIYSTKIGREVTYTTSPFSNFTPFENKYEPDPTLPKDAQVLEEKGVEGRKVTVVRIVKERGQIIHKDKIVSNYKPKKAIYRVGTGEAPTQTPSVAGEQVSPPQPTETVPPGTGSPSENNQRTVGDNVIQQNGTLEQQNQAGN